MPRCPFCLLVTGAVVALSGCGESSPDPSSARRQTTTEAREPGVRAPIRPARRISSRQPTQVVGGPLFFRTTDRDFDGVKDVTVTEYALVFRLNRDPLVLSDGENNNHGRGDYAVDRWDISDDGGLEGREVAPRAEEHRLRDSRPLTRAAHAGRVHEKAVASEQHRVRPGPHPMKKIPTLFRRDPDGRMAKLEARDFR